MKVVTAVVNNPIFIEIQYRTLKKYFKGEYEFIVFNDAKDYPDFTNGGNIKIKTQIQDICTKLNITCINIPNNHHKQNTEMSSRHSDTFNNHVLKYQKENPDQYLLLDSDMFLIDYFDINKYLKYEAAIVLQSRNNKKHYIWPGLCYLDFNKIKNIELLDWRGGNGCDSGGMMNNWLIRHLDNNPMPNTDEIRWGNKDFHTDNTYFIKHLWSLTWDETELPSNIKNKALLDFLKNDPRNQKGKFFCEIYDNKFLHYRAGGNWRQEGMQLHYILSERLKKIL